MRRRVVCPRSHPASPYLRRPLADFAMARGAFPGGIPPDPLSPYRALGRLGGCHLRPLGGVRAPAVLRRVWGGPGLLLPGVTACAEACRRGGLSRGVPRGRPGMAGRRGPVPWRAAVPGRVLPASLGNTEPAMYYAQWPFPASKV